MTARRARRFMSPVNNPLIKLADGTSSWLLAVNGADAYVSPDWYVSPDQVPTWLYQAVHLTGAVRTLSDDELAEQIETLSAKFEERLLPKKPWLSSKMTAGRLEAMKKAIVGLVMTVEEVEGSFKLNQHKSDADYTALTRSAGRAARRRCARDRGPDARGAAAGFRYKPRNSTISAERNAT